MFEALSHTSLPVKRSASLACLGDRTYNVWAARKVWERHDGAEKGRMTHEIIALCEGPAQRSLLRALELDRYILFSAGHTGMTGGGYVSDLPDYVTDRMGATALEAVVAAVELDADPSAAFRMLERGYARLLSD